MEHFQKAGLAVLQALLIYCKIDVEKKIADQKKPKKTAVIEEEVQPKPPIIFTKVSELKIEYLS
jgi:hypothetical protein